MADDVIEDELLLRRRKLIKASKSARTKEEIEIALKPFKSRGVNFVYDDREVTITRDFEASITDPTNNKVQRRKEVTLTVSGNLFRPIEDFVHDVKWLLAQAASIQDAQRTLSIRRA